MQVRYPCKRKSPEGSCHPHPASPSRQDAPESGLDSPPRNHKLHPGCSFGLRYCCRCKSLNATPRRAIRAVPLMHLSRSVALVLSLPLLLSPPPPPASFTPANPAPCEDRVLAQGERAPVQDPVLSLRADPLSAVFSSRSQNARKFPQESF